MRTENAEKLGLLVQKLKFIVTLDYGIEEKLYPYLKVILVKMNWRLYMKKVKKDKLLDHSKDINKM
jgi:hypothetical protein